MMDVIVVVLYIFFYILHNDTNIEKHLRHIVCAVFGNDTVGFGFPHLHSRTFSLNNESLLHCTVHVP